jgi:hypothetical protein
LSPLGPVLFTCAFACLACGRVAFDAITGDGSTTDVATDSTPFVCTPSDHDEDADGVDDACDVCPHSSDPLQPDTDGDRVGDQCDPEPTNPRQQIVFFDPFVTLTTDWFIGAGPIFSSTDEVALAGNGGTRSIYRPYTQANDWFVVGATTTNAGAGNHLFAMLTSPNTGFAGFYCEMFYDVSDGFASTMFTYTTDGSTFLHDGISPWSQPLANGGGTFEYLLDGSIARCRSTWLGDVRAVEGVWPVSIVPERFTLYADNLDVQIQWFVQIRTL